jgi:hypothetical protein
MPCLCCVRVGSLSYFCGMNLSTWQERTHADAHTRFVQADGKVEEFSPTAVLARARTLLWKDLPLLSTPLR